MKLAGGFLAISLSLIAFVNPSVGVRYRVVSVDRVEHQFYGEGQSRPVIGVFSTVYKSKGKQITGREFWSRLNPGDQVDAKVKLHNFFSIAVAGNLSLDK